MPTHDGGVPVNPEDLRRLYGHRCRAVFHCHGCGRAHSLSGTLKPGRLAGDVVLAGLTLPVTDLISIDDENPTPSEPVAVGVTLPYLWLAWALLVWLLLLARR